MKKDEMIAEIQIILDSGDSNYDNAVQILQLVEDKGMKPPHHPNRKGSSYCSTVNWDDDVYEWE